MKVLCHHELITVFLEKSFIKNSCFFDQTFFLKESLLHDLSHHYRAFSVLIIEGNVPDLHKAHTPV